MKRFLSLILLATACSGRQSGGTPGNEPSSQQPAEGPRAIPIVAVRLAARGGPVRVYSLPSLAPAEWQTGARTSPARAAIGVDAAGRRLLYRDSSGAIDALDLVALLQKTVATGGRFTALATDGTLLVVTPDGGVVESEPWGIQRWPATVGGGVRDAFAGPDSRLIVVRRDSLISLARDPEPPVAVPVPRTAAVAGSRDGDAIAFATDSGLVVAEDRDQWHPWFVRLAGSPVAAAFAPSGYRVYVALKDKSELAVVDRFQRKERPTIPLPGPASDLRMDPWGRVVMVRPADRPGDTWVVGVASGRVAGRLSTQWSSDLPTVSEGGVLLSREGRAVVAHDVRSLDSLGAVADGAGDLWFLGRWKPSSAIVAARQEARRAATEPAAAAPAIAVRPAPPVAGPPSGPAPNAPAASRPATPAAAPAPAPEQAEPGAPATGERAAEFWVQVSASQNERQTRELAAELARAGYASHVASPLSPTESWRVLIGPYGTRSSADSAARTLGRPYWITGRGPGGPSAP
ncbi:MAG TPA: SPOR domain-containing protein [Gemmatimonadales bacterium]|nr:SPOR domain-containing protein [Gemmatimonadales bacterium]